MCGHSKHDGIPLKEQIREYHYQSQLKSLLNIKLEIYEYLLDSNIQKDIKNYYYIKLLSKMCNMFNISNDIEKLLLAYF